MFDQQWWADAFIFVGVCGMGVTVAGVLMGFAFRDMPSERRRQAELHARAPTYKPLTAGETALIVLGILLLFVVMLWLGSGLDTN